MKKLYLIRHAKSSWKEIGLSDFERGLNKRGKKDAPMIGNILKKKEITPDIIISSPAKRTKKTAFIIAKSVGIKKENIIFKESIYESSMNELLNVIENLDNSLNSVFLIGHNPSLNVLAEYLTNSYINNIPTCGVLAIDLDINLWNEVSDGCGKIEFFDYPKNYNIIQTKKGI